MRNLQNPGRVLLATSLLVLASHLGWAQGVIVGQVVSKEGGRPLGYTTIGVVARDTQFLSGDGGAFVLRTLSGDVRLRFRRIGFSPRDTIIRVAAGDTARIKIEMSRLVIELPTVVVDGRCEDRSPLEPKPGFLSELFDQVKQNAERMRLLIQQRPFTIQYTSEAGFRDRNNRIIGERQVANESRAPLAKEPYAPRRTVRPGTFNGRAVQSVYLPELTDLADTAFTNNHCFSFGGRERFETDSVVRVDFVPVPWLARAVDIEGQIYLRVTDYQLVGIEMRLNRIPRENRSMRAYSSRVRFTEVVSGISVRAEWELTNTMQGDRPPFVLIGKLTGVTWQDSAAKSPPASDRPR
jgi:hypothetical protein